MCSDYSTSSDKINLAVAKEFSALFATRDIEKFSEAYADDAKIWHNFDSVTQTKQESMALIGGVFAGFRELSFENVRTFSTEVGFVQQHDMVGTNLRGGRMSIPSCVIASVKDGKISRLEEYLEPSALFSLLSAE